MRLPGNVMFNRLLSNLTPTFGVLLTRTRSYFFHAAAVGVCAIIGLWLGFVKSEFLEKTSAPKDAWKLPQMSERNAPTALGADDVADLFWSDEPRVKRKVEAAKPPVGIWRFIGTFAQGAQLYAIIVEDQRVKIFKAGDTLPDGAIIQDVQESNLSFELSGSAMTRRLYEKELSK